jgi:tetratricopeptide (TPR) repeat protein
MKYLVTSFVILLFCTFGYGQTATEYFDRGNVKYKLEDYQGAISDYNKAIKIDPRDRKAYYNRGAAKLMLDLIDSGCLDLSKAGELGFEKAYEMIREYCN